MRRNKGFTLIELMIVIAIIAIIAAIAIPGLLQSQRASNERNASTSLKTLTSAEADFRANDRDGNRVNDFWTFDVKGLYTMTNAAMTGAATGDPPIKLIELGLASADALSTGSGLADDTTLTTYAVFSNKAGFWYNSLVSDLAAAGDEDYTVDTGGSPTATAQHHSSKFGFTTWPDSQSSGKFAFIVNENNTIFRRALTSNVKPTSSTPPGRATANDADDWPSDASIKSFWSKID